MCVCVCVCVCVRMNAYVCEVLKCIEVMKKKHAKKKIMACLTSAT